MLIVGLTGGVGSGKSTVAELLVARGVVLIDADVIAREVVASGTPGFAAVVDRFGPAVVGESGALDRSKLAEVIFSDKLARAALEEIIHPLVRAEVKRRTDELRATDSVVLLVVPLLVESGQYRVDRLVVVDCDEETAVKRLMSSRGYSEMHARQRIAAQISRQDRVEAADYVIDNTGGIESLQQQVDRLWTWLED